MRILRGVVLVAGQVAPDARIWLANRGATFEALRDLWLISLPDGVESEAGSGEFSGKYTLTFPGDPAMDHWYVVVDLDIDARETRLTLRR